MTPAESPKKLIEVALPLDAINKAAAREKSIRHGHLRIFAYREHLFSPSVNTKFSQL